jgi:hypothetical protein
MGNLYRFGYNPFQDFLLKSIMYGTDISDEKLKPEIQNAFQYILQNILQNGNEAVYLDFEIRKTEQHYKVVGKNAMSAVWLSGIFPMNAHLMMKNNVFKIGDRTYKYNPKTCELSYKLTKVKKKTEK